MSSNHEALKAQLKRWTLLLGVIQITFGCIIGFIPPSAVEWFRGLVMAHIEFTANGVLVVVFGFLIKEFSLSPTALKVWFVTLQIGTWTNGTAGLIAAFIGSSSILMPTINEKFPPPNAMDHPLVTGLLKTCGVTIITALRITIYGLFAAKAQPPENQSS